MGLAYKSGRDTEMRMELWGADLGRHFMMLENNIRKKLGEYEIDGIKKGSCY